jgi:hypothetical protein
MTDRETLDEILAGMQRSVDSSMRTANAGECIGVEDMEYWRDHLSAFRDRLLALCDEWDKGTAIFEDDWQVKDETMEKCAKKLRALVRKENSDGTA